MLVGKGNRDDTLSEADLADSLETMVQEWIERDGVRRLLLVPPDRTRFHSRAGDITAWLWRRLAHSVHVDILPATGTHQAMTAEQVRWMFGRDVALDHVYAHRWRDDVRKLGEVSTEEMQQLSADLFQQSVQIAVNQRIVSGEYDMILSIGQVVPHEVIGLANYTKNIVIGTGGPDIIHKSHFLGAICDMERIMGRADTPVRRLVDGAFDRFIRPLANVRFVLTVVEDTAQGSLLRGLFIGDDRATYLAAAELSRQVNVTLMPQPLNRCVVFLDPQEYGSTWLGNKAIYRTRMAMSDGGLLTIIAPGVRTFGEDATIDQLVRQHGYRGTRATLQAIDRDPALASNLSAAAHLIHGSTESRFHVTYCVDQPLTRADIEEVGYQYLPLADALHQWPVANRPDGWYEDADGEPYYFIRHPGLGLWASAGRFAERTGEACI